MDFVTLKSGDVIGGRYELLDKLGAGAFGAVFRARQLGIDRMVAIKLLMPEAADIDGTASARFTREAKLSSSLEHPNTITIHDYGQTDDGMMYLVMEYVRGDTLQSLLRREVRLDPDRAVRIVRQVLQSLHEAHSRGIVHRDMKPANIMLFDRVGARDVVKVLDFGIAKFVSNDGAGMGAEAAKQDLTVAGRIVGTPRYMSPEQINGKGVYAASDLYALGLIFYEMIAGRRAVIGDSTLSLIACQISAEAVIEPDDPFVPGMLRPIVLRATAKNVEERYSSAQEFLEALDDLDMKQLAALEPLEGRPGWKEPEPPIPVITEAPLEEEIAPPPDDEPAGLPLPWIIGAAAAVFLVALVGGIALFSNTNQGGDANTVAAASSGAQVGGEPSRAKPPVDEGAVAKKDDKDDSDKPAGEGDGVTDSPEDGAVAAKGEEPKDGAEEEEVAPEAVQERQFTIASTPEGASVTRGEELLGKTPLVINLKQDESKATFQIAMDGYKPQAVDIDPGADETEYALKLQALPPKPQVKNNRANRANRANNKGGGNKGGGNKGGGNKGGGSKGGGDVYKPL